MSKDSREAPPADKVHYKRGMPPVGAKDTPENEVRRAEALEGVSHGMTLPNEEDVPIGAPACQRCEVTPAPLRGPGAVHIRFGHTHTLGKAMLLAINKNWKHSEREGTLTIHVGEGSLDPLLGPLMEALTRIEQRDTRALFQPYGHLVQVTDYFDVESLPDFVARSRAAWLLDVLREKRLLSVFQPIVSSANSGSQGAKVTAEGQPTRSIPTRSIFAYECLMRAKVDGQMVLPGEMLETARASGLIFQLDLAARRSSILGASGHGIGQKVFINFAPNSIYNPYTCLDSTVRLVDDVGLKREQVVFEIIESERLPESKLLRRIVDYYRDNGFGVALDDVGSGYASLHALMELRPDYVKLDISLTRGVHQDKTKAVVARKLIETVQELGLKSIAEGIELEEERQWVEHHGADFMQGYLFARPATPPPALLA